MSLYLKSIFILCSVLFVTSALASEAQNSASPLLGLPPMPAPAEGGRHGEKIKLGKKLFFDTQLSGNGQISCASCHIPQQAFTDNRAVAEGIYGRKGSRKTPSIINAGYNQEQFWDGRRASLQEQVLDPFFNPNEHGVKDITALLQLIRQDAQYQPLLQQAFAQTAETINKTHISEALTAYVRTLNAADSPFDRYLYGGDQQALTPQQVRGLALFRGAAQCDTCHSIGKDAALLTDGEYHSMSIGFDSLVPKLPVLTAQVIGATEVQREAWIVSNPDMAALGRFMITLDPQDIGKFKTPSLRNIVLTSPYMHDGSLATLEEAVDREIYYRSESMGRPLILTPDEKQDLVAFLHALTSPVLPETTVQSPSASKK
ncbi:MAG: cytochrome-c peroxidase [Enterobacteriaceae bacterium]